MPHDLPATGERTAPGLPDEEYWFARHLVTYQWCAEQISAEDIVVDAGAGEGYGADLLPGRLRIAADYDAAACTHLHARYPRVSAVRANLAALPLRGHTVDAVVTLQVLEHIWDPLGFLGEVHRVLRPGGRILLSTPNRLTFSPGLGRGEKPTNPFHIEEFDAGQLHSLLTQAGFAEVAVLGLHHAPRIRRWESLHGSLVGAQVAAVTSGTWGAELREMVSSVTTADFAFRAEVDRCEDLIAVATA